MMVAARHRYTIQAAGVSIAVALTLLVCNWGSKRLSGKSLALLLTQPAREWIETPGDDSEEGESKQDSLAEADPEETRGPEAQPEATRVRSDGPGPAPRAEDSRPESPDVRAPVTRSVTAQRVRPATSPVRDILAQAVREDMVASDSTPKDEDEQQDENPQVEGAEEDELDLFAVESARRQAKDLLRVGGDLVEEGATLPMLIARFSEADIEAMVMRRFGVMAAQIDDSWYVAVPLQADSLFSAVDFTILTEAETQNLGNRSISLNRRRCIGGWRDLPMRQTLRPLELQLMRRSAGRRAGNVPEIVFFGSSEFEQYLARKQLGALASLGINQANPDFAGTRLATLGTMMMPGEKPVYIIEEIQIGSQHVSFEDPESILARSTDNGKKTRR